jgi:hypothetical protein
MGPLFDRAESLANTLHQAHELIEKDLGEIGQLVTAMETSISNTMDQVTYLQEQQKKLLSARPVAPGGLAKAQDAGPASSSAPSIGAKGIIIAVLGGSILSAVLAAGVVVAFNRNTIEDARIGRAVVNALPHIDAVTKKKLEDAIQKAGS